MTQSVFPSDFLQKILEQIPASAAGLTKQFAEAMWLSVQPYWPYLAIGLFVLLFISTIRAMFGKWGVLGSLLYHIIYFGILGIIVWIKGWEILFNPLFDLISFVIYRLAYMLVGLILRKFRR
jgi:signal transduction histidine kinase